jgi:adenylate cyclase
MSLDAPKLKALLQLRDVIDSLLEEAMVRRQSVATVMARVLPKLCEASGARGAFIESYTEDLKLTRFSWPVGLQIPCDAEVGERTGEARREVISLHEGAQWVLAKPLDVAGAWFGRMGLVGDDAAGADLEHAAALLDLASEELDDFLFAIKAAREKHGATMALGEALRHRVLAEGLKLAVDVLTQTIPVDRMLMVYVAEESSSTSTLHVHLFERGKLTFDTFSMAPAESAEARMSGRRYLFEGDRALLERFGLLTAQEEVLISGITHSVVVGKIVVTSTGDVFNTYDREILGSFAGFVRQRIVDFNKEWRRLAASFRADDVTRLLQIDDYEAQLLAPREEMIGILYADIAGFTRLSEQVLKTPAAVASLVEAWSEQAVNIVWKHGGVFDKMVGDCIIALFGPPFYESTAGERLAAALRCAKEIRQMTIELPSKPGFEVLREGGLGVATGVNLASLFVGTFGPNSDFTGFSAGMNNTARLQGCAKRDQILVMEDGIASLPAGHGFQFGEPGSAAVKNVAQPLRFRPLL